MTTRSPAAQFDGLQLILKEQIKYLDVLIIIIINIISNN